jgi:hypothetical protein
MLIIKFLASSHWRKECHFIVLTEQVPTIHDSLIHGHEDFTAFAIATAYKDGFEMGITTN